EHDLRAFLGEAHPELDVLDGVLDETAGLDERLAAEGPKAGPKRRDPPAGFLMDEVVQEVPEAGDHSALGGIIVRAEDRDELGIALECRANALQRVGMHLDVRVDEHDDVTGRTSRAEIPRYGRADSRRLDDGVELVTGSHGGADRSKTAPERCRLIGCWNDDRQAHVPILGLRSCLFSQGWETHDPDERIGRKSNLGGLSYLR